VGFSSAYPRLHRLPNAGIILIISMACQPPITSPLSQYTSCDLKIVFADEKNLICKKPILALQKEE
jgi:hypothetical protein